MAKINQILKSKKIIIGLVTLMILGIGAIITAVILLFPLSPNYTLVYDTNQSIAGIYHINTAKGLFISDLALNESLLKTGVPSKVVVKIYDQNNVVAEKEIDLSAVREAKKNNNKYKFELPLNHITLDNTAHELTVKITSPAPEKEYSSDIIKVMADTKSSFLVRAHAAVGGAEVVADDIKVYTNKKDALDLSVEFDEPVQLSLANGATSNGLLHNVSLPTLDADKTTAEITYVATDSAGNLTNGKIIRNFDTQGPVVELLSPSTVNIGGATSRTSSMTFYINESFSSFNYKGNEAKLAKGTTNQYNISGFTMVPGVNEYEVVAVDLAGNESRTKVTVTATKTASTPLLPACTIADSQYCLNKVGGNPCDPAYVACKKARCSGTTQVSNCH